MKTSITVKQLAEQSNVTILDVRKKPAFDEDTVIIAGAQWRDPAAPSSQSRKPPPDR